MVRSCKFFLLLGCLLAGFPCLAEEPRTIKFATGEWPPWVSEAMSGGGVSAEIVTAVVLEMGYRAEFEFVPWKRAYQIVENGDAWATFPVAYTEKRASTFNYSGVIGVSEYRIFRYGDRVTDAAWNNIEDLKPYKLCGAFGFFYIDMFKRAGLDLELARTEDLALKMLVNERCDILPMNKLVGWFRIDKIYPGQRDNFSVAGKLVIETHDLYIMASKTYPGTNELLEKFDAALARIKSNGTYQRIMDQAGHTN